MTTYIALLSFTPQGIQHVHDSPHRAAAFKHAVEKAGVHVRDAYWTMGAFDGVLIFDAENDEAATEAMLALGVLGNVRAQTLRTFNAEQFSAILDKAPRL